MKERREGGMEEGRERAPGREERRKMKEGRKEGVNGEREEGWKNGGEQ